MNNLYQPTERHTIVDDYVTGIRLIEPDTQLAQWRLVVDIAFASPLWLGVWDPFDMGAEQAEMAAREGYAVACNRLNQQREAKRLESQRVAMAAVGDAIGGAITKGLTEA